MFLCAEGDRDSAQELQDHIEGKLRKVAEMRTITGILAEDRDVGWALRDSDCVVLIASHQALSLIQNKQQETKGNFVTFDGKMIHEELEANPELVKDKLVIIFLREQTENDWIPTGFDTRKIFHLQGQKIKRGNPALSHLEHWIRQILGVNRP